MSVKWGALIVLFFLASFLVGMACTLSAYEYDTSEQVVRDLRSVATLGIVNEQGDVGFISFVTAPVSFFPALYRIATQPLGLFSEHPNLWWAEWLIKGPIIIPFALGLVVICYAGFQRIIS